MKKILIIEDDKILLDELMNVFRENDFEVAIIENFAEVIFEINTKAADLIILDLNLPYKSGFEILNYVKDNLTTPVLILTSRSGISDELLSFEIGADEFLPKPVNKARLIARANHLLNIYEKFSNELRIKDISFDPTTNKLSYNGNYVILAQSEGDIMGALIKAHPNTLSKDELLIAGWSTTYTDENILQVNLTRLRKKLKALGLDSLIENVRKVGYRLKIEDL